LLHGSGVQTSGSIARPRHGLEHAGDQRSCHIEAGRDCRLKHELKGSSWPHRGRAQMEAMKANKAYQEP